MKDELINLISNPTFMVVCAWAGREWMKSYLHGSYGFTNSIKENSDKLAEITVAIARIETKLETLQELSTQIPQLKADLSALSAHWAEQAWRISTWPNSRRSHYNISQKKGGSGEL